MREGAISAIRAAVFFEKEFDMMRKCLAALSCGALLVSGCLAPQAPCVVKDVPVVMREGRQLKDAIIVAAQVKGWTASPAAPGVVRCTLVKGTHKVVVDVKYAAEKSFSIQYVSSENMKYDAAAGTISRKYNQWVRNLDRQIRIEALR